MSRKVLIITYYWPPAGGPGVQRVLKFAKYLPEFGWEPIILTVEKGEYPATDQSLLQEVSPGLEVIKTKSFDFYDLYRVFTGKKKEEKIETYELIRERSQLSPQERLAQFLRMNFLLPDGRVGWYLRSTNKIVEWVRKIDPALIFSSSPPHSVQLIAKKLSRKAQIKWVADYRDPWTQSFYDKGIQRTRIAQKINARLEQNCVGAADAIVTVSQGVADLLPTIGDQRISIIPNGFDEDDFHMRRNPSNYFDIVYTGHAASTQNPVNLWKSLSELSEDIIRDIKVSFYGSVDTGIQEMLAKLDLLNNVEIHKYIPHKQAIQKMVNADCLLLLIPKSNSKGILTGKVFEYLATGNKILGIGDPNGAAAIVLKECDAGRMISYNDSPIDYLLELVHRWKMNKVSRINRDKINRYSRKNLTLELAKLFNEVCHE